MQRLRNILLSLTFSFSSSLMAQDEDIVVTTTTDSKIFRVSIESTDSADLGLLNNAFTAHGAYKVVPANQSEFHLQFIRKSENTVECAILLGRPARELKRFVESGN